MTSLLNLKTNNNRSAIKDLPLETRSTLSNSSLTYGHTLSPKRYPMPGKIRTILSAAFGAAAIFQTSSSTTPFAPSFVNQSAIVIEERIRRKITLAEAHKLSISIFKKYEENWNSYLKEETAKFLSLDDF
jgi:hypothetical protein